jgi:hypothetical protein
MELGSYFLFLQEQIKDIIISRVDLPGVRHTMTGSVDDASAARGFGARASRSEACEVSSHAWGVADFPTEFKNCKVRCHEDVPRQGTVLDSCAVSQTITNRLHYSHKRLQ